MVRFLAVLFFLLFLLFLVLGFLVLALFYLFEVIDPLVQFFHLCVLVRLLRILKRLHDLFLHRLIVVESLVYFGAIHELRLFLRRQPADVLKSWRRCLLLYRILEMLLFEVLVHFKKLLMQVTLCRCLGVELL